MSIPSDCCNPCVTTPPVNIPGVAGIDGAPGAAGAPGQNAYTIVTAPGFNVPALNANVAVPVANALWMIPGQNVIVAGPANFQVVSINNALSVNLKFLGYTGDVVPGTAIAAGAGISPAGLQGPNFTLLPAITSYALAGSQALTNSFAQMLSNQLTLTAGTYLLMATARLDFVGATFAASENVELKLRETTNGPADIANAVVNLATGSPTLITATFAAVALPPVTYAAATGDTIELYGTVAAAPGAGDLEVIEVGLIAIRLF